MKKIIKYLVYLYLVSIPFSFVYVLKSWRGNASDTAFLNFGVYLSDVFGVLLFFAFVYYFYLYKNSFSYLKNFFLKESKAYFYLSVFLIFSIISFSWSGVPFVSLIFGFRLFLVASLTFFVSFLFANSFEIRNKILFILSFSGFLQSLLAFYQFLFGRSFGLYFLGENHLSKEVLGLPYFSFFGHSFLRAFGTLPHPNILGGFLLLTMAATLFLIKSEKNKKQGLEKIFKIILFFQVFGMILTFSRGAILGFFVFSWLFRKTIREILDFNQKNKKIFFLFLIGLLLLSFFRDSVQKTIFLRSESSQLRVEYLVTNLKRFSVSPILGRGLATGPIELPAFSDFPFYVWENQPVHNIFVLILSDLGIFGFGFFLLFILEIFKKIKKENERESIWFWLFLIYLFIGLFDHYFLTLPYGIFIFFLSSMLFLAEKPKLKTKLKEKRGEKTFLESESKQLRFPKLEK